MKFSVSPTTPVTHAVNFGCVVVDLESPLSTDPVTLSIGTNPSAGVLSGTLTVNAVNGIAVFGPLQISLAGNGYTLVATAPQQHYGITSFAPVGQFQPGLASAAAQVAFQPGYYYNYPVTGDFFPENTVTTLGEIHGNVAVAPVMISVTSNPFNVV